MKSFWKDKSGNFVIMFALSAPVMLVGLAITVDYSNAVTMNQRVQAAADSAALAATTAMANSITNGTPLTVTQAQTIATNFFNSNAPAQAVSAETSPPGASTSVTSNSVTTVVTYSGAPPTLLSGIVGTAPSLNVSATSYAKITTTVTQAVGNISGTGWIAQDPVVQGADGSYGFMESCDITHATWYNLISDSGFEVNANCDGTWLQSELYQVEILAGTHTIYMSPGLQATSWAQYNSATRQTAYVNQELWYGDVTIDGQVYPAIPGTSTYLNDTTEGVQVTVAVGQPGVSGSAANYVLVTTSNYSVSVAFDSDDDGSWNFGMTDIQFSATNAGACGALGGVWGGTTANNDDSNWSDFIVSGRSGTASQFAKSCNITTSSASRANITQ